MKTMERRGEEDEKSGGAGSDGSSFRQDDTDRMLETRLDENRQAAGRLKVRERARFRTGGGNKTKKPESANQSKNVRNAHLHAWSGQVVFGSMLLRPLVIGRCFQRVQRKSLPF